MNQSWGRGVWGSGTVIMTHSRCVSERRTEAGRFSATMTTDNAVGRPERRCSAEKKDVVFLDVNHGDTPLYGSSFSPTSHYHNTTSFFSAFKAVFVSSARAQARAPNCSLCVFVYIVSSTYIKRYLDILRCIHIFYIHVYINICINKITSPYNEYVMYVQDEPMRTFHLIFFLTDWLQNILAKNMPFLFLRQMYNYMISLFKLLFHLLD